MPTALTFAQFPAFLLVFVRVAAMIGTMPLLGERMVPRQMKVGISLLLAVLLFPLVAESLAGRVPENPVALVPALVMEVMFGAVMGFAVRLVAAAVEFAGEIAGYMLGLTIAQAVDPQSQLQVPIIGQFLTVLAFLIFLAVNAHHVLISALAQSFAWVPPTGVSVGPAFADALIDMTANIFRIGLQLAAPVVAAMLLANVGLGIITRAVPQMHVLVVAMPATIVAGLLILGLALPYMADLITATYQGLDVTLETLMGAMR